MKVSIIVPVFNEEATVGQVLDRLAQLGFEREVIVVDDGSTDRTPAILNGHDSELIIEQLPLNRGKGAAVRRGIELATGDVVVIQDADLEMSPSTIASLVDPIQRGEADAVYGSRFLAMPERVAWTRRLANRVLTMTMNLVHGVRLTDMETAHKAMRMDLVRPMVLVSEGFEIEVEITAKLAAARARLIEVPSPYRPRTPDEGKKISWVDGIKALAAIWRWRPRPWSDRRGRASGRTQKSTR